VSSLPRLPIGTELSGDVEKRSGRTPSYRARIRWIDPATRSRPSRSSSFPDRTSAEAWVATMQRLARAGRHPDTATLTLADYGDLVMSLAMRGLEPKSLVPYDAGWRLRVLPALGHVPVVEIGHGEIDRVVHAWIADGFGQSTIKNSLAALVRILQQAVRDGLLDTNPAKITGWQRKFHRAEDELDDPRSLALPDWDTLTRLADALVERSADHYRGWGDVTLFAACTAARIGEVSGCRLRDINTHTWRWTLRRQTTTSPGGLADKATKGKRARVVPLVEELHEVVERRIAATDGHPDSRLFTGPRGGRISTAVLRDATHWDDVVAQLGYEHLRRHSVRHTGLTWMADAGVPIHVLRRIAGHGSITTTQRYLHPDDRALGAASDALSRHLRGSWSQNGPKGPEL
jgi:integrase